MAQPLPRIGILETGRPPENLASTYPDYPKMVANWLAPIDADFISIAILDGELPQNPRDCDLWVITGSKHGVYENHPWIAPIETFIRSCRDENVPMVGICFGHQLIAQALGADVRKSEKGWGLGVTSYPLKDWPAELGAMPETLDIQAYHQDQVQTVPEGAQVIASTDFCPISALWYPGFAVTVQGHPEFESDYFQDLIKIRKGTLLTEQEAQIALESQSRPTNQSALAQVVKHALLKKVDA